MGQVPFSRVRRMTAKGSEHTPSQLGFLWRTYIDNVDPLMKVLHVPTVNKVLRESSGKLNTLPSGLRCLLLAICLAAMTSLTEQEVSSLPSNKVRSSPSSGSWNNSATAETTC